MATVKGECMMGIRKQLRRTTISTALISLTLVACCVATMIISFINYYQEKVGQSIQQSLADNGISEEAAQQFLEEIQQRTNTVSGSGHLPFIFISIIAILVVVLVSAYFTTRLSRKFIAPLEQLTEAANRVAQGDLNYTLDFKTDNEFETVREAFSDMQEHLRDSIGRNVAEEQVRREMLAGISHDLRTPLTAVKGYVKGLKDGVAATPEKTSQYLDTIYGKTLEMERMVDQLFLFSKLDAGETLLQPTRVDADSYLRGYVDVVAPELHTRGMDLDFCSTLHQPVALWVDCDEMARVFGNILENSIKYKTGERCRVTVTTGIKNGRFAVEFADDGCGVPEDSVGRLFDTFYRADPARSAPGSGSGLGLSIAQRIVAAHGGQIYAFNHGGLAVTILLPLEREEDTP